MKLKLLVLSLFSFSSNAGTMGLFTQAAPIHWVGTFSIGPVWATPGAQQTLNLTPDIEKTYTAYKPTNALADGELFLGLKRDLPYKLITHIGIAGALTSKAGLSGEVWDVANPRFNNYVYGYHIQHGHVALKAKIFNDLNYKVLPWISGSIGVGFNRANEFYNHVLIPEAVPQNNFANHTQTSLTYTVGAGIQKLLDKNWQAGVGYEFADWGQSHLNAAPGQTLGTGIKLFHLYTNGLMFNMTYIA